MSSGRKRFSKIIKYTKENYFNILIGNFQNQIKQIEESFYISFYMKKCSCEKKIHKNKFRIIFNIKKDIQYLICNITERIC